MRVSYNAPAHAAHMLRKVGPNERSPESHSRGRCVAARLHGCAPERAIGRTTTVADSGTSRRLLLALL